MQNIREVVLDTETTGLSYERGDRIIEIGCVELVNKVFTGNVFHTYINPQKRVNDSAYNIHGISNEFLKDKKTFTEIKDEFISFIKDAKLVIHNAKFDIGFINNEFTLIGVPKISVTTVVDTLMVARKKFPGSPASLDALCKRFNISLTTREKHGALIDAKLLAMVYVKMVQAEQVKIVFNQDNTTYGVNKHFQFPKRKFSLTNQEKVQHDEMLSKIPNHLW